MYFAIQRRNEGNRKVKEVCETRITDLTSVKLHMDCLLKSVSPSLHHRVYGYTVLLLTNLIYDNIYP